MLPPSLFTGIASWDDFTVGLSQKLFVSRYLVALPSVVQLKKFVEADRARLERR